MQKEEKYNTETIGNENSYTEEFFEDLYKKLDVKDLQLKKALNRYIILAAQKYIRLLYEHHRDLSPSEVKKELQNAVKNINKAAESITKIYMSSGNHGSAMVDNLYVTIFRKYPSLHGLLDEIFKLTPVGERNSPARSMVLLQSMAEALNLTLENYTPEKRTPKSIALYDWAMIISAKLELALGRKLENGRYHEGEYISKRKISDSELLLSIIKPLDPNITISQIETAIKETRQERHKAPWDDYFPM